MKNKILFFRTLITLLVAVVLYYFMLPPLNLTSPLFWIYVFLLYFVYMFTIILKLADIKGIFIEKITINKKNEMTFLPYLIFPVALFLIIIVNIVMSPVFQSKQYYQRITIGENGNFTEDVKPVDFNALPHNLA